MRALRPDEPGTIGGYRLVGVIGAGGMGRVFLAVAPDGRLAAVKQVLASADPAFRARFAQEVRASRAVSGAHTAAVLDAGPDAPVPWLASVFVPGPSLAQAVAATGPLPEPTVRRLAAGVAAALGDIHRAGLVHRDVKPANVLLTEDGPRVVDFGIAHDSAAAAGLTGTGSLLGTAGFLAPEQLDGPRAGPPADVFGLGVLLAFAASGVGVFHAATPHGLLYQVAFAEPDLSRVPPELRPMIAAFLAKRPEDRPTPQQILQHVGPVPPGADWLPVAVRQLVHEREHEAQVLVGSRSGASAVPTPGPGAGPPERRARRRWPWVLAAGVAATAVAAGVLVAVNWRGDTLSVPDAVALVARIAPSPDSLPAGYRFVDDRDTPNMDGALAAGPSERRGVTRFACDIQGDPPVAAEAGLVAGALFHYLEDVGQLPDRLPDSRLVAAFYVDGAHREQLVGEVRLRIGACRSAVPPSFTSWNFAPIVVPGVDEQASFVAVLPVPPSFPDFPPQVYGCTVARVDAVVLRGCGLLTSAPGDPDPSLGTLDELDRTIRDLLGPVVTRARDLQAAP